MPSFTPCRGKQACVERGEHCITCGRSLDEIARTRRLIDELAELALDMNYDNADDFAAYVGAKLAKKIHYRRDEHPNESPRP